MIRVEEAAAKLGKSNQTIYRYFRTGALTKHKDGDSTMVDEAEVLRLKEALRTLNPREMTAAK